MSNLKQELLNDIIQKYIHSHDFNGYVLWQSEYIDDKNFLSIVEELVHDGDINLIFWDKWQNFHIIHFPPKPIIEQIQRLQECPVNMIWAYPTPKHLEKHWDLDILARKPYYYRLSQGEAQLSYQCFDMAVLEMYRNDPKYHYEVSDFEGHIYYNHPGENESSEYYLKTFWFGINSKNSNRCVIVFLRYLSDLSEKHQQI